MIPFRVLSRTNLAERTSLTSSISFISFRLRTLKLSCRSFSHPDPLFSITSALFLQNTRGVGYLKNLPSRISNFRTLFPAPVANVATEHPAKDAHPGRPSGVEGSQIIPHSPLATRHSPLSSWELLRCTEAQKCLSVSPLLATLTHSVSRKSFPCHSYANTRDMGVTAPNFFLPLTPIFEGPPLTSARSVSCSVPLCLCRNFQSCPAFVLQPDEPISSIFDGSRISFRINTCKSVSKQTTSTPFRINTCEKHREGESYC